MAFTEKYGKGGDLDHDDDGTARALRDAGFKIIRFGEAQMIYVGQANYENKPHGKGYMYQRNGDVHECDFAHGRAHGNGVYFSGNGKELHGTWTQNKRVGVFHAIDSKGVKWTEKYDKEGKRTSRTKDRIEVPNPDWSESSPEDVPPTIKELVPPEEPAVKCWNCDFLGRERNNHAWACRSHRGRWTEDREYRGDGPTRGVWSCCGKETKDEPGCSFQMHDFRKS
eukprot:m.120717 g.120717  ORF g.120717 m.120717 type:complete len:225 (+) comp14371_c0_seq2:35-709(+)